MPDAPWTPDIVVGVDFGMTCTAVAWSMSPQWTTPKTLQRWPGKLGHDLRNKVSTAVSYKLTSGELSQWGFLCNPDAVDEEYNELFKLYLDPNYHDDTGAAPEKDEVHKWFRDYLICLRKYILGHLAESQPRFETKKLEFIFSVPTTWREPAVIASVERTIRQAGYGVPSTERASVYMTEAEAAAVYASGNSMQAGEVFLICDAGGGTTDVNILKMSSPGGTAAATQLTPLCWSEGLAAGSTLIDFKFSQILMHRLQQMHYHFNADLEAVASAMVASDTYIRAKCSLGHDQFHDRFVSLRIPDLPSGVNMPHLLIQNSHMTMAIEDLQAIFDQQIARIITLIDQQLRVAQEGFSGERISYLILSGGLGSSPYLRKRIKERYQDNSTKGPENAQRMKILLVDEPQLSVVHGLVMARTQEFRAGPRVFQKRCCPVSYGIVCRQRYDPEVHRLEDVTIVEDLYDKSHWVDGQITWMIKQAELVDAEKGARKSYRMRLPMGHESQLWKASIVTSSLPSARLPQSVQRGGSQPVCDLEFSLHPRDLKRKNRHWYELSKEYSRAGFEVRMLIGTGLRFEVWGKDGLRSRTHEEIAVDWVVAKEST